MAAHQLLGQLQLVLVNQTESDRTAYSKDCCRMLCDDIEHQGAELLSELYLHPGVLEGMLSTMAYSDLLRFAEAHGTGNIEVTDPTQIQILANSAWKVIKKLSSDEIKQHFQNFKAGQGDNTSEVEVTGDPAYDRSREFCAVMNQLLTANTTAIELGIALHQSHENGHLTMNMLDELMELKASMMGREFADQATADTAVAGMNKKTLRKMYVAKELQTFKPDCDNPVDVLWLGRINMFDSMLKGDIKGKNKSFRNFVRCWDEIRYRAMPAYNAHHKKDSLVETDGTFSKELGKVSPQLLDQLDQAKGDTEQVQVILKKMGLRKAPDKLSFTDAIREADKSDNPLRKQRLKHLAAQDCLYRYFEQRAGVEIPLIPPKPESLRAKKPQ